MAVLDKARSIAIAMIATSLFSGAALAQTTYSTEQAEAGATTFQSQCAMCHGATLEGGDAPALSGADFRGNWGTAAGVHGYFSVAMPPQSPGALGEEAYLNIAAYIMQVNGIPAGDAPATVETLASVDLVAAAAAAPAEPAAAAPAAPAAGAAPAETGVPQAFTWGKQLPTTAGAAPAATTAAAPANTGGVPQAFTWGKQLPSAGAANP